MIRKLIRSKESGVPGKPVLLARVGVLFWLLCFTHPLYSQQTPVEYQISLKDAARHIVNVSVSAQAERPEIDFQLPVWNALYQVRDFAKNVIAVSAKGQPGLTVKKIDKTTWQVFGFPVKQAPRISISYQIIADQPGPFGAQLNSEHAFFNLAEILVYPVGQKDHPVELTFTDVPENWKKATPLKRMNVETRGGAPGFSTEMFMARNYDQLVDSPFELGTFQEFAFAQDGAMYSVVIDASPKDYKPDDLLNSLRRITAAETAWMNDRPFDRYLFIYHFPEGPAGGGMEHAYSTSIAMSASSLENLSNFNSVSAHEFFHLWNVKRIRPQSLEPINYTRENYTRALWFSEGVTSTVADLVLLKAGLLDEKRYLSHISSAITTLQNRPAHLAQSAEESSLDAWLEGYPAYRLPERSISYYNKGEVLGVLLDLKIRQGSQGKKSLRDLFQAMNEKYAKRGKFFADSEGVRASAEALTGSNLREFFRRYVAGTEELSYAELFRTVGLTLEKGTRTVADPGFTALRNFDGPLTVIEVTGRAASEAGILAGDEIVEIEGKVPARGIGEVIRSKQPGSIIRLTLRRGSNLLSVKLTLESRQEANYELKDLPDITAAQRDRRKAWLNSEDEGQNAAVSGASAH